jgi:D-amino-acid dehydrogenase
MTRRVVIVGGGIIGAACAHFLVKSGHAVEIVEQGEFGHGCSHANCGFVCPSHVLPLAQPGAIRGALKALLSPDSPFTIRPRFDPALWSWLFRFTRRCNQRDMLAAGEAIKALLVSSRALYDELFQTEKLDVEWETRGLVLVFQTPKAMDHYAKTDQLLRERFEMGAGRYDGEALEKLEPALRPGLAGGWHYPGDAHLRPDKLLKSWRSLLESRAAVIHEQHEFKEIERDGGAWTVQTSKQPLKADAVVIATGAWTPLLYHQLGCPVPIQPGKGYSITMAKPAICPTLPMLFEEHRVAVTPMRTSYRLGSTMEFAGYDSSLNPHRLGLLRSGAAHYLREPCGEPVLEEWYGWRPMTSDGKPFIGPVPGLNGVFVAAGHGMLGLSMAPATGRMIAEMIDGTSPHLDPAPYQLVNRI